MKKLVLFLLLLPMAAAASTPARFDLPVVMTTPAQVPVGSLPDLLAVTNATVAVCGYPATANGVTLHNGDATMCTNTIATYTDSTLGTACPSTAQLTAPGTSVCIPTTGLQGVFGFWYDAAAQTHMTYTLSTTWGTFGPYDILPGSVAGGGSGTVTNFTSGNLSPLFSTSVANGSTAPVQTFAASPFSAHTFYGNNGGSTATPGAVLIGASDFSPNAYVAGSGSAQTQTVTLSPAATALTAGLEVHWLPVAANTGAGTTLNVNSLGARQITKLGSTSLAAGDLTTTAIADAIYDGTRWQLQNPQTSSGGGCATCIVSNPTATQTISQPAGTEFDFLDATTPTSVNFNNAGGWNFNGPGGLTVNGSQFTLNGGDFIYSGGSNFNIDSGSLLDDATTTTFNHLARFNGVIEDELGNAGTNGQVLTNVGGAGVEWMDASGGSGSPAGVNGNPQINASGSFGAGANVFYQQSGDTIASIESACSSLCTYVVTSPQTITLTASHTLNANVLLAFQANGSWTVNGSGFTLTIPTKVAGTLSQHFVAGTGSVKLGTPNNAVPVEWFGASAGASGATNLADIQAALNALTIGQVKLSDNYSIAGTLAISTSNIGIGGIPVMRGGQTVGLTETVAGDDAVDVHGASAGSMISFGSFQDFTIASSVLQTGTAAGLSCSFAGGITVRNVYIRDFVRDAYIHACPSFGGGGWFQVVTSTSSLSGSSGSFWGFYLDSADGNANNSLTITNSDYTSNNSSVTTYGMGVYGTDVNDWTIHNFNTAASNYGVYISRTTGSATPIASSDIHIIDSVLDGCKTACVYINNLGQSSNGSADVVAGWFSPNHSSGGAAFDIVNSSGVQIVGTMINSGWVVGVNEGIILDGSTHTVVTGNVIETTYGTMVHLIDNSTFNIITGNSFYGQSATSPVGITLDAGSNNNTIQPNNFDTTFITTPVTDNGTANGIQGPLKVTGLVSSVDIGLTNPAIPNSTNLIHSTSSNFAELQTLGANATTVPDFYIAAFSSNQSLTDFYVHCVYLTGCTFADPVILPKVNGLTTPTASGAAVLTQKIQSGTATMGTSAIAAGACATAVTVAATGVATTDVIEVGFNGDPTSTTGYVPGAMLTIVPYPTAGNVNFKVCNNTASSITPSALTINWRVQR